MRVDKRYLAIVCMTLSVVMAGCAASSSHLLSKKGSLIDHEHGAVVVSLGSVTMTDPVVDVIVMRSDGKPANFKITSQVDMQTRGGWNSGQTVRFMPNGAKRMLVAYAVSPGHYSIDSVELTIFEGNSTYTGSVKLKRPLGFDVEAGKVTYLGVIEVDKITAPNLIGEYIPALSRQVPSRMSVRVLDEFEEDNRILISLRPELKAAPVLRPSTR